MRKILIVAAMSFVAPAAQANENCDAFAVLAKNIMDGRQNGVAARQMMDIASGAEGGEVVKEGMRKMVIAAYETPEYSTSEMKNKAVRDFENSIYLACIKAVKES